LNVRRVGTPEASTDPSIRVILAELPAMVAAIVRDAVTGEGIRIVDEVNGRPDLPGLVSRWAAHVMIVPADASGVARQYHELLRRMPGLKILTLAAVSHSADVYELRMLGTNVGRRGVVAAIRAVTADAAPGRSQSPVSGRRDS
jgi:hypothetical protein